MARTTIVWGLVALAGGLLAALYLPGSGVCAQTPDTVSGQAIVPLQKLEGSATWQQDNFGWSLALDGDYLVVGAPHYTTTDATPGSAYIFKRNTGSNSWTEVKQLLADDGRLSDRFGYAVAISGDKVVIGAPWADVGGWQDAGAAYVFRRDKDGAGNWGQVAKLTASDIYTHSDHMGTTVAIDGNTIVVGAAEKEVNNVRDAGAAYIFTSSGTDNWSQSAILTATTPHVQDLFGRAVTIDGDTVVVGAPWANTGTQLDTGFAQIFYRSGTQWNEVKKISASDPQPYDRFGTSLALDGDTLVVGAPQPDYKHPSDPSKDVLPGPGAAYIFERNTGGADQWGQRTKISATEGTSGDRFGFATYVTGDVVVVGAYLTEVAEDIYRGAAYVFERNAGGNNVWGQTTQLLAQDGKMGDQFGFAVAAQGNILAVGAPYANRGTVVLNSGAVYLFFRADYAIHLPVISR
ncbi:MAG: FG-GAP repeat protein [Anaerolineae bacterium]